MAFLSFTYSDEQKKINQDTCKKMYSYGCTMKFPNNICEKILSTCHDLLLEYQRLNFEHENLLDKYQDTLNQSKKYLSNYYKLTKEKMDSFHKSSESQLSYKSSLSSSEINKLEWCAKKFHDGSASSHENAENILRIIDDVFNQRSVEERITMIAQHDVHDLYKYMNNFLSKPEYGIKNHISKIEKNIHKLQNTLPHNDFNKIMHNIEEEFNKSENAYNDLIDDICYDENKSYEHINDTHMNEF